jgi:hypothetical protein
LTLVTALVATSFAAALFVSRFVTKAELRLALGDLKEQIQTLDSKFDKFILKKLHD